MIISLEFPIRHIPKNLLLESVPTWRTKWLFNRQRKVCCAQIYIQTDPPHYGNSQQRTYNAFIVKFFLRTIPL